MQTYAEIAVDSSISARFAHDGEHFSNRYWSNFAKTGDPGTYTADDGSALAWPRMTVAEEKVMNFTSCDGGRFSHVVARGEVGLRRRARLS